MLRCTDRGGTELRESLTLGRIHVKQIVEVVVIGTKLFEPRMR